MSPSTSTPATDGSFPNRHLLNQFSTVVTSRKKCTSDYATRAGYRTELTQHWSTSPTRLSMSSVSVAALLLLAGSFAGLFLDIRRVYPNFPEPDAILDASVPTGEQVSTTLTYSSVQG